MCTNNNENISCRTQTGDDFVILCPEYIINNNSKESSLQHYNAKFGNIVSENGNCIKIPNDKSQRKRRELIFIDPGKVHKKDFYCFCCVLLLLLQDFDCFDTGAHWFLHRHFFCPLHLSTF